MMAIVDMLPTFCSLTGTEIPTAPIIDGVDLSPTLFTNNDNTAARETFAYFDGDTFFAFRYREWKLFVNKEDSKGSNKKVVDTGPVAAGVLFHLGNDPQESKDVSAQYPEIKAMLHKKAEAFLHEFKENKRKQGFL